MSNKKTKHVCLGCGYIYDEKRYGDFEDLDDEFLCPECNCEKDMFEEREIIK
jgi:rubredoxin